VSWGVLLHPVVNLAILQEPATAFRVVDGFFILANLFVKDMVCVWRGYPLYNLMFLFFLSRVFLPFEVYKILKSLLFVLGEVSRKLLPMRVILYMAS
jgi:hypothetical protein